jgi:hypothetical protein
MDDSFSIELEELMSSRARAFWLGKGLGGEGLEGEGEGERWCGGVFF